jgi:hypothetical protein
VATKSKRGAAKLAKAPPDEIAHLRRQVRQMAEYVDEMREMVRIIRDEIDMSGRLDVAEAKLDRLFPSHGSRAHLELVLGADDDR